MRPEPLLALPAPLPAPALPAPAVPVLLAGRPVAPPRLEAEQRFAALINRAGQLPGAQLVFRMPARPGSGYREVAAFAAGRPPSRQVTLVTLAEDGATIAIAPSDPALAPYDGLARSFAGLIDRWGLN